MELIKAQTLLVIPYGLQCTYYSLRRSYIDQTLKTRRYTVYRHLHVLDTQKLLRIRLQLKDVYK